MGEMATCKNKALKLMWKTVLRLLLKKCEKAI